MRRRHLYEPANERLAVGFAFWVALAALIAFDLFMLVQIAITNDTLRSAREAVR